MRRRLTIPGAIVGILAGVGAAVAIMAAQGGDSAQATFCDQSLQPKPVCIVTVFPSDFPWEAWASQGASNPRDDVLDRADRWVCGPNGIVEMTRDWHVQQSGMTYITDCLIHVSNLTARQIQSDHRGVPYASDTCMSGIYPGFGQGLEQNRLVIDIGQGELGMPIRGGRAGFIYAYGGGYAAGGSGSLPPPNSTTPPLPQNNWGQGYMGSWGLHHVMTGLPDPCCVEKAGGGAWCGLPQSIDPETKLATTAFDLPAGYTWSHEEGCHARGIWGCHPVMGPQLSVGVPFTPLDLMEFLSFNADFLVKAGVEEPLTVTPVVTVTDTPSPIPPTPTFREPTITPTPKPKPTATPCRPPNHRKCRR